MFANQEKYSEYDDKLWGVLPIKECDNEFEELYGGNEFYRIYKEIYLQSKVELLFAYNKFMKAANNMYEKGFIIYNINNPKRQRNNIIVFVYALLDYLETYFVILNNELITTAKRDKNQKDFIKKCKIVFANDEQWNELKKQNPKNSLLRIHIKDITTFIFNLFIAGHLIIYQAGFLEDRTIRRPRKYSLKFFRFANEIYLKNKDVMKNKRTPYFYKDALLSAIAEASGYEHFEKYSNITPDSMELYNLLKEYKNFRYETKTNLKTSIY